MHRSDSGGRRGWRKGGVVVVFAAFLPVFFGMIALAVDLGVIATAQAQISGTADAAALAGGQQLFTDNHLTANPDMSSEVAAAQSSATAIAQSNSILGQRAVVLANASNAASGDVVVGYLNPSVAGAPFTNVVAPQSQYNAVQVTISRDPTHGGVVPAFFSRLEGFTGSSLSVTSVAVAENYVVGGFASTNGASANILPIVLDQSTYNAMVAGNPTNSQANGLPTDNYAYSPATGAVTSGPDGLYESTLFPVSGGSPGNWGTVRIGVSNNGTSTLCAQIIGGITPAQLATFPGGTIQLSNRTSPPSIQLGGNPGVSAGISSSIDSIIGQTRFIPIYSSVSGPGSNASYTVVKFAGVRVMASNFRGNPKYVVVQPALVIDSTAIPTTVETTWSSGGLVVLRLAR